MRTLNSRIWALRSRVERQEGFTLVEIMVAMGIMFVSLLALARTATVAFSDVAQGRQRLTANQLANQLLEEVRGLPYETVEKGLKTEDLAGDPRILSCSGSYYLDICPPALEAEEIKHTDGLPDVSPLVPHTGSIGPSEGNPNTFTWSVYVTTATEEIPSRGAYRVTVYVSWSSPERGGAKLLEVQTLVYAPEGCVNTDTHPYGSPCQPYFYGNGSVGGGAVTTTGTVTGLAFDSMAGRLPSGTADIQVEQVGRVEGAVQLHTLEKIVSLEQTTSGSPETSVADTDPSTAAGVHDAETLGPAPPATMEVTGSGGTLSFDVTGGSQGSTTSTTAAGNLNSCNLQLDDRPCGYATVTSNASLTHSLDLAGAGIADLADVAVPSGTDSVYARRDVPGTDEGLIRERIEWALPEIRLGELPSGMTPPLGWQGYWVRLTGFSASAQAEAGVNTTAPIVTIAGGSVEYWTGEGYASTAVTSAGGSIPIEPVNVESGPEGDTTRVVIQGEVSIEESPVSEEISAGSTRTAATAEIGAPLFASFTYQVIRGGVTEADLAVVFDAGSGRANTLFQEAPAP